MRGYFFLIAQPVNVNKKNAVETFGGVFCLLRVLWRPFIRFVIVCQGIRQRQRAKARLRSCLAFLLSVASPSSRRRQFGTNKAARRCVLSCLRLKVCTALYCFLFAPF